MWQDPRFEQLGHPPRAAARLLQPRPQGRLLALRRVDAPGARARRRRAADDQPALVDVHPRAADAPRSTGASCASSARAIRGCGRWAAWNEANHKKQPLFRKPRRAAQFYNVMREECRGCTIVAADVLDSSNMLPWLATFKRYARHPRDLGPAQLHRHEPLQAAAGDVDAGAAARGRGQVWLTETGGIVRFADRYHGGKRAERRAARAVRRTFRVGGDQPAREARLPLPLGRRPALPHVGLGLRARERQGAPRARRAAARAQPAARAAGRAAAPAPLALPAAQAAAS